LGPGEATADPSTPVGMTRGEWITQLKVCESDREFFCAVLPKAIEVVTRQNLVCFSLPGKLIRQTLYRLKARTRVLQQASTACRFVQIIYFIFIF
jgi:hypothetical protein